MDTGDSPRNWDNLSKMVCFHRKYNLGDKHSFSVEDLKGFIQNNKNTVSLPLYLCDHGGITMNTKGFFCPWDSGQVGRIYATREQMLKEFGGKRLTKTIKEKTLKILQSEVETYDKYIRGDVVGFIAEDKDENNIDSCWGFYDEADAIAEAQSSIDFDIKEKQQAEQDEKEFQAAHPLAFQA